MGNREDNLRVITAHIDRLAESQQTAVEKFTGANRAAGNAAGAVGATHGAICIATSMAVADIDAARANAGQTMQRVSAELHDKLINASKNYQSVDYLSGTTISNECRV